MYFEDFNKPCCMCSIDNNLNSVKLSLQNIFKELSIIEEVNNLNDEMYSDSLSRNSDIFLNYRNYEYNFDKLCGYCTNPSYNQFTSFQEHVSNKLCNILSYIITENLTSINLSDLKNSCKGYYASLAYIIETVEAKLLNSKCTKEGI